MKVKTVEELRTELTKAEAFAAWAATADDEDAPALLFYPKPLGKGLWSWKVKAKYDAEQCATALKAAEATEAAKPKPEPEAEEEERPQYVPVQETAEQQAARLARYAAEGRDKNGTLIHAAGPCSCVSCASSAKKAAREAPWSDAECQAAVDLWGWSLGAELIMMRNEGKSLDDIYGPEMQQAWDDWCAARHACAAATEAAEKARIEANWQRAVVEQAMVEARRNLKRNEAVQKNGRICTRCYSCVGSKSTNWEDGGHRARPSTLHVSDVCFTHQAFLDGKIREDCPFLHGGDKGWHAEWDTNILWDPSTGTAPVPRHVRSREGPALVCISESSAGHLPLHLGGKPATAQRSPEPRFTAMGGEAKRSPEGRFAALAASKPAEAKRNPVRQ